MTTFERLEVQDGCRVFAVNANGGWHQLHPIWLRERSSDPESWDEASGQRLLNAPALPLDLAITSARSIDDETLEIAFSDGCRSIFRASALLAEFALSERDFLHPGLELWEGSQLSPLPTMAASELVEEAALFRLVQLFFKLGFVVISGVGTDPEDAIALAERLGHVRVTNFGRRFDVIAKPRAEDLAYTAHELQVHTDGTYRYTTPGVQVLHALINEFDGGESVFVDGFAVAERLRREHPEDFRVLTHTTVFAYYTDPKTVIRNWGQMIRLDQEGNIVRVAIRRNADFVPPYDYQHLSEFYLARQRFVSLLDSEQYQITFRLNTGDLVIFNNERVLHGRTRLRESRGRRHLSGFYLDLDGPLSLYWRWHDRMAGSA